ncbi:MAG: hypothetical protein ACE5OZ_26325 [Candidatus Heimdallarchaeota archaeon]
MNPGKNTKSFFRPPNKPLLIRLWLWTTDSWHKDWRPFVSMLLTIVGGIAAAILNLSSGLFLIFWISAIFGVVFFGACYFIWNIASITIILLIERHQAEEWELETMKYWLKRNIVIAGMWAIILMISVFIQPGWPILATINGVVLAFIVMFAESEESPFGAGEKAFD